jgi:acyl-CoA reductase-like NAD-dependent aldehyde dehydrogenase
MLCSFFLLIVFAPIMLVMKYDTIDDAVDIANSTRYGLGASVFGPDSRLCKEVALALECGMVSVNDFAVYYVSHICSLIFYYSLIDS